MLENYVEPIPYLQSVKNQYDQFKIHTGTYMTHDKYYELLLSAAMTHDKKFKRVAKFGSEYWWNFYDLKQLPNDDNEDSFDIDSYIDMIQACYSHKQSISSIIPE